MNTIDTPAVKFGICLKLVLLREQDGKILSLFQRKTLNNLKHFNSKFLMAKTLITVNYS